jgi:diaminohydroxyphosphoribosylaminopyrimidine deaminase/5-amino-6-(5-phosphoribosylamino)uracil reductase
MRLASRLAGRGYGGTSPNPMVGAVLVKGGKVIGRGWHHRAGEPHAEIEALQDARKHRRDPKGATLYVTLEPCCTHGRTPPCTDAIIAARIKRVVTGATDPNPRHCGQAYQILRDAGIQAESGLLANECERLNEAFNHWIVHRTPFVTVKAAMTLDGKIATAAGESKWITGEQARGYGNWLRQGADAILVGVNTVLADDPSLTVRGDPSPAGSQRLRRIILDSMARTPLKAKVACDEHAPLTTIVVSEDAPKKRVAALAKRVRVLTAPLARKTSDSAADRPAIDVRWLLKQLGSEQVTSLLVEGGGEVNGSFLLAGLARRIAFFYAPKVLGGRDSRPAVGGPGARSLEETLNLASLEWKRLGPDWLLTARVASSNQRNEPLHGHTTTSNQTS